MRVCLLLTTVAITCLHLSRAVADEEGFVQIFDNATLADWDGNPKFWRVEDQAITGQTTPENPTDKNTFIIWRGGELDDFELKLQYRIIGGNSGIQYRSFERGDEGQWSVGGYQADLEAGDQHSGILYGEHFRGILAQCGQKTVIGDNSKPQVIDTFATLAEIQSKIQKEDWNDYHITANGYHFVHRINGVVTAECTDEDKKIRRANGILALQIHAGPPMKVQFRDIRLKRLAKSAESPRGE